MAAYSTGTELYVGVAIKLTARVNEDDATPSGVRFIVETPDGATWQAIDGALEDAGDPTNYRWNATTVAAPVAGVYTWQAVPKVGATVSGASPCRTFTVEAPCVDLSA